MARALPDSPPARSGSWPSKGERPNAGPGEVTALARNSFHLFLGQIGTVLLSFVLNWALGRWLGVAGFGDYYLIMRNVGFTYLLVEWGQPQNVIREVAREPHKAGVILGSSLAFRGAAATALCVPAALVAWLLGNSLPVVVLTGVLVLANLPQSCAQTYGLVFRGREAMHLDAMVTVAFKSLVVAITVPVLLLGGALPGAILAQAGAGLGAVALAVVLARRVRVTGTRPTLAMGREIFVKGTSTLSLNLVLLGQSVIDPQVLSIRATRAAVGWYAAAMLFMNALLMPAVVLGSAAYPSLSRVAHDLKAFRIQLTAAFRPLLIIGALAACGTFLFADLAVSILYDPSEFGPAVTVLQVYAPALFLVLIDVVLGTAILAAGRPGSLAASKLLALALGAVLDWVLVPVAEARWGNGGVGIVLSCSATELVMLAAALYLLPRGSLDRRLLADLGRVLAVAGAALFGMALLPAMSALVRLPVFLTLFAALSVISGVVRRNDLVLVRVLFSRMRRGAGRPDNTGAMS